MTDITVENPVEIPIGEFESEPEDFTPPISTEPEPASSDFDPEFPGSTPEAPYGYKPDGTPYKRRPNGAGPSTRKSDAAPRLVASNKSAEAAGALLANLNNLVSMAVAVAGMPMTAETMAKNNRQFEAMAVEALRADPALCRKILAAGQDSARAALTMAYLSFGASVIPVAWSERKVILNNGTHN